MFSFSSMLNKNMSFKSSYIGGVVIELIGGKLFEDVNHFHIY